MAVVAGWDAAALAFLMSGWPIIMDRDSPRRAAGKTHLPVPKLLAVPRATTSVPVAEPGVMMGLEINTLAMQGLSWRCPQMPLRGDAASEGRWAPGLAG
jgi:hypothetical protein